MPKWPLIALVLGAGCPGLRPVDSDETGGNPDEVPETIPETYDLAEDTDCETFPDSDGVEQPVPGATTYWLGEIAIDGSSAYGWEAVVFLANDAWESTEGYDCQISWILDGDKTATETCPACEYRLELHAVMDMTTTDCVEGLVADYQGEAQAYDFAYEVDLSDEGSAQVYFDSGTLFAEGSGSESSLSYMREHSCSWF